jgi:glycosyltransferase involved in cell wall biosynthesis
MQKVSVLIRTRDIERHLHKLLLSISHQTLIPSELIIVNNFSSKNKLNEMIKFLKFKCNFLKNLLRIKIVPIEDKMFSYPYSVNVGVYFANNDLVCITNGHCLPLSNVWLESGVYHFKKSNVAGVAGYTIPHLNSTAWEKIFNWGWRKLNEFSKFYVKDSFFSTTNCIIRKKLWEVYPFDEKIPKLISNSGKFGGEDYDWGLEMMARNYKLIVEPKFDVYHSHRESIFQLLKKYFVWHQIRIDLQSIKRPRKSYNTLNKNKLEYHELYK